MALSFACGRYQEDEGAFRQVVYATGRKRLHIVWIDIPVRVRSFNIDQARYITPVLLNDKPYPLDRAARLMLRAGKHKGITHQALALLKGAIDSTKIEDEEFDDMNNNAENPMPITEDGEIITNNSTEEKTVSKKTRPSRAKAKSESKATTKAAPKGKAKVVKAKAAPKAKGERAPSKKADAYPVYKKHKDELGRKEMPRGWISMVAADIAKKVGTNPSSAYDYVKAFLGGAKA